MNVSLGSATLTGTTIAGSANVTIRNTGAGSTTFTNSSIAGAATVALSNANPANTLTFDSTTITTTGSVTIQNSGQTTFKGSSNAGSTQITNAGSASTVNFQDTASAGQATIANNATATLIDFTANSAAGNATISNNANFTAITFGGSASAQNATIANNASSTTILFSGNASGGNAALVNNASGSSIDISSLTSTGTTAGSIAGKGTLSLGSKLLTVGSNNLSTLFSGVIADGGTGSGSGGSLTKVGSGTLQLTGVNTYSGGTSFNGGIVAVNQDSNLGTGGLSFNGGTLEASAAGGGITSGKALVFNAGGGTFLADPGTTSTFSGILSGAGGLTKTGAGTLLLAGSVSNTYTGPAVIAQGLLELNNSGGSIAIPGALVIGNGSGTPSNAEVRLLQSGQIAGASAVTINADGLFNINGQTASVGAVAVNNGSVSIGAGSLTLASLQQTGGAITGGSLVLNGNVTAGAGANGSAALISSAVNLNGAARTFTVTGNPGSVGLIVTNVISNGGLTKSGSGAMALEGANTYTGTTTVNGGALYVDGSIASANTIVQSGALLGGHGILGGSLLNTGSVSPGNSPGTLTVTGNFNQPSSGRLLIEIGGLATLQHDLLKIGGSASLGGTMQLVPLNDFRFTLGDKVTVLTAAGGLHGTFDSIINPFNQLGLVGAKILYEADAIVVEGVQLPFSAIVGLTPNQRAVASALDNAGFSARTTQLLNHLDNEPIKDVLKDLDRIAPDELTSIYQIGIAQAKVQTDNLQRRLEDVRAGANGFSNSRFSMTSFGPDAAGPTGDAGFLAGPDGKSGKTILTPAPENRWGVFVSGDGEWANTGDTSNARGYNLTSAGVTLGVDFKATPHLVLGLAAGYSRSDAYLTEGGRITVDGGKLALYGSYFTGGFYVDAALQGGYNTYNTNRASINGTARGTTDGGEFNGFLGTGYDWKSGALKFGPIASFEYTYLGVGSFTERGSLTPLDLPNQHQESLRSTLGARAAYDFKIGGAIIRPEIRVAWQHEYGDAVLGFDSRLASGAGSEFLVHGPATGRDSLLIDAGFAIIWNQRTSTYLYYNGELCRENYEANGVSGGVRLEF